MSVGQHSAKRSLTLMPPYCDLNAEVQVNFSSQSEGVPQARALISEPSGWSVGGDPWCPRE